MDYIFITIILVCGLYDFKTRIIPNKITFPLIVLSLIYQAYTGHIIPGLIGFGVGFGIGAICFALKGMGGGDVKMMAALGTYLGTYSFLSVLFIASILGVIWGLTLYLRKKVFIKKVKEMFLKVLLVQTNALKLNDFIQYDNSTKKQHLTIPFGTCLSLALVYIYFYPVGIL